MNYDVRCGSAQHFEVHDEPAETCPAAYGRALEWVRDSVPPSDLVARGWYGVDRTATVFEKHEDPLRVRMRCMVYRSRRPEKQKTLAAKLRDESFMHLVSHVSGDIFRLDFDTDVGTDIVERSGP